MCHRSRLPSTTVPSLMDRAFFSRSYLLQLVVPSLVDRASLTLLARSCFPYPSRPVVPSSLSRAFFTFLTRLCLPRLSHQVVPSLLDRTCLNIGPSLIGRAFLVQTYLAHLIVLDRFVSCAFFTKTHLPHTDFKCSVTGQPMNREDKRTDVTQRSI